MLDPQVIARLTGDRNIGGMTMLKEIKLSEQTTIVVETVQPAENVSDEINIYLKSGDDVQDLLLIREKLEMDHDHQNLCSDPNKVEVLVWDDPNNENYTKRTLITKRTSSAKCSNSAEQLIRYSDGQLDVTNINNFTDAVIESVINDHNANRPAEETFDFKTWLYGIEVVGHYYTELIDAQDPSLGTRPAFITIDALDNQIVD